MAFNDIPNKIVGDEFSADEFNDIIAEIKLKQTISNLVTSFGLTPSDTNYPSEKLVKTSLNAITSAISDLEDDINEISGNQFTIGKIDTNTDLLDFFEIGIYPWDATDAGTPSVSNNFPINKQGTLFVVFGSSRLYFDEDGEMFSYHNARGEWEQIVTKRIEAIDPPTLTVGVPVADIVSDVSVGSTNTAGKIVIQNTSGMARNTDGDYIMTLEFSEEIDDIKTVQLTGGNNSALFSFYVQDVQSTSVNIALADCEIPETTSIEVYYKIN